MSNEAQQRLRVAAIHFLNPAPLLYNFEHAPADADLARRYDVQYTSPALCAEHLRTGEADLGLVPIGALPFLPEVQAVPGCTIASLNQVRSIQLVLRPGISLQQVRSIAADRASRSSAAYVQVLLRSAHGRSPSMVETAADLPLMLADHDAALLIGDPALLAMEAQESNGAFADCTWIDVATWWREQTGLPWVAAVWAARPQALTECGMSPEELTRDLCASRDAGLMNIDRIVLEWAPRIALPAERIRGYLTQNIHYTLDAVCTQAIDRFYTLAESTQVLPPYTFRTL